MTAYLKNYHSVPRIARVAGLLKTTEIQNDRYEFMIVQDKTICFSTDGYSCELDDISRDSIAVLHTGDIVTINTKGIFNRIFDSQENNATVFLTSLCNSNCIMCPTTDGERKNEGGMSDEWMIEYIELLPENLNHVVVTGGEPTLRTELFFRVMARLAERFPEIEVLLLSNGRSFAASSIVNRLSDYCPPYLKVAIPIHGGDAALHDSITRVEGSFEQTCKGIRNLMEKRIPVELRIVVSALNYQHLDKIVDLILQSGWQPVIINFIGLEVRGNCAKYSSLVYIEDSEVFPYLKIATKRLISSGLDVSFYNYPLCAIDKGFWSLCKKSISPYKVRFFDDCDQCDVKSYCGGFFDSTFHMIQPEHHPIC